MLKTAGLPVDPAWEKLLAGMPQRVQAGLSRLARWASLRHVGPEAVDNGVLARFVAELEASTLVRSLRDLQRQVALSWNLLVERNADGVLKAVLVPSFKPGAYPHGLGQAAGLVPRGRRGLPRLVRDA